MSKLAEIRKQKGVSQLKLAQLTGISPWNISRLENGWMKPYPGWRRRIARALRAPESELFPEVKDER